MIKAIAVSLEGQDYSEIDLTLEQFGFGTYQQWEGSKRDYVMDVVKNGTDDAIRDLNDYLHPSQTPTETDPPAEITDDPDSPWKTGGYRLFISHVVAQKGMAHKLARALKAHSIEAFVAHDSIEIGDEWELVIRSALRTCHGLAVWLTPTFPESKWCDHEVGFAVGLDKMIVPIRFNQDPYGFIGKYQGMKVVDGDKFSDIARTIFDKLVTHPSSCVDMAGVLVRRYADSGSFDEVRSNFQALRKIPVAAWTDELKRVAVEAEMGNGQVKNAFVDGRSATGAVQHLIDALG
jgi:hypothetical protein